MKHTCDKESATNKIILCRANQHATFLTKIDCEDTVGSTGPSCH